jgi:RHS repeat-associated protein
VNKNGYLYVYVSNETTNLDVFFDNLQVTHIHGPIVEETHYYPFGLTMGGISSKAAGSTESKKKFQGQEFAHNEFSDGSGLEMYEFRWRMDDPQIGRFWQIDPLSEKYVYNSTYAFSENKVTGHVELEGLEAVEAITNWIVNMLCKVRTSADNAMGSAVRQGTGQSNEPNTPAPRAIQGIQTTLNKVNDVNNIMQPAVVIHDIVNTLASLVPAGEAGAATEISINTFKAVGQATFNLEGKAIAKELGDPSIAGSFKKTSYEIVELQSDIQGYRTFGAANGEKGSFFGFTKPANSAEAEKMYNLAKHGNDASFVTPVTIKKGTQVAIGLVDGGTGGQIYIPSYTQANKVTYWSKNTIALPAK